MVKKVGISNKVVITCLCEKSYNHQSQYKYCKNKLKCSLYCLSARQNYYNIDGYVRKRYRCYNSFKK